MNSDENKDYAQYIIQKHILAIAIAIIKTRPADLSLDTYLKNIRESIYGNMDRHIDVVICEEDFNLSSDDDEPNNSQGSVNILNNFDLTDFNNPLNGTDELNTMIEVLNNVQEDSVDETHCTQSTFFNESQKPIDIENRKVNEIADNIREICENYNEGNANPSNKIKEIISKEIINTTHQNIIHNNDRRNLVSNINRNINNLNENNNDNKICSSSFNKINISKGVNNETNVVNDNTDSQETVQYTLKGFTCNTHVSQSQDVMVITNNKLLQRSHNVTNNIICEKNVKKNIENIKNIQKSVGNEKKDANDTNIYADLIDVDCATQNMYTEQDFAEFYANNIEGSNKNEYEIKEIDEDVMFDEHVGSKKHKNNDENVNSDIKRKKIVANEMEHNKKSRVHTEVDEFFPFSDTSSPEKIIDESDFQLLSPIPKCQINKTSNEPFDFEENTQDQDMDIFKDSVVLDDDENFAPDTLMRMDKFSNASNDLMPVINQERQRLNNNKDFLSKNMDLQFKTILNTDEQSSSGMKFKISRVSHEIRYPNSLEYVKTKTDYERTKFNSRKPDSKVSGNEFYKNNCTDIENNNPYIEVNSVFDEPFINLSQNISNADSKVSEDVSKPNTKIESEAFSNNTYTATNEFNSYPQQRLNKCILNNLAYLQNDTEEEYPNANKRDKEFTSVSSNKIKENNENNDQNKITKECISNENTQMVSETENFISDNEENQNSEIVSFKIIEELKKIKSYLSRRERIFSQSNSSDSGFKSSYKSASPHCEARINQSAHCLLSFMSVGPLSDRTTDIADEVSKTLGRLVDKLHEEERCPDFLEALLDRVTAFIKLLYEGNNAEEYSLSKKEDTIDRLLLLNRSSHIINFTIQKIITILENLHSELDSDVMLELKDIDRAENLGHIFDVLEILIKRAKKSNELSQLSQISIQDDDKLKRSSLTEIWKRKWNLTGSEAREGNAKKKCALTKCGEILNKIIVKAMDGYSLISFAALQCFNLLQN